MGRSRINSETLSAASNAVALINAFAPAINDDSGDMSLFFMRTAISSSISSMAQCSVPAAGPYFIIETMA